MGSQSASPACEPSGRGALLPVSADQDLVDRCCIHEYTNKALNLYSKCNASFVTRYLASNEESPPTFSGAGAASTIGSTEVELVRDTDRAASGPGARLAGAPRRSGVVSLCGLSAGC